MDIELQQELSGLCDKQIELATDYKKFREMSAKAGIDLDILLVVRLSEIRREKPNCGYDMAVRMLMETNTVAQNLHRDAEMYTAKYKGLEKLVEAYQNKISALQSLMKYRIQGERYG